MQRDCPLCSDSGANFYHQDKKRRFFECPQCYLVFAEPEAHLQAHDEKAIYNLHSNSPDDEGYRRFLSRVSSPLLEKLHQGPAQGLDFGCGPGPTLSVMLEEAGHQVALYDPYFSPDKSVLEHSYDFITCTEAIEHFNTPAKEWRLLLSILKPGGWLAIMTKLVIDAEAFSRWHYKNDPTHVSFFSRNTFMYLAKRDGLQLEFVGSDVILMRKKHL